MQFFEDMSELPVGDPSPDALSDSLSFGQPIPDSPESSTELSAPYKQVSDPNQKPAAESDSYQTLQWPQSLLYAWPEGELAGALGKALQPPDLVSSEAKVNNAGRSKGIRKVEAEKKKVIKQMRNRISAQKSRDRKKQELDELREEADRLRGENSELKSRLTSTAAELELLHRVVDALPRAQLQKLQADLQPQVQTGKSTKSSGGRGKKCPLLLATLIIGCFCFAACISPMMRSYGPASPSIAAPTVEKPLAIAPVSKPIGTLSAERYLSMCKLGRMARREYIEQKGRLSRSEKAIVAAAADVMIGKKSADEAMVLDGKTGKDGYEVVMSM